MADYKYVIPKIPPSNNKFIGRNARFDYNNQKKEWQRMIFLLCRPIPEKPIDKAVVYITYYFPDKRRRDPDNYSGKFILDGLVRAGILTDDDFSHITLRLSGLHDKTNPRTEISIKENENVQ